MSDNQTSQQPITQSRQRGAQTTPAHLHWCGAYPPSSWPAQAASHESMLRNRIHIVAIFPLVSFYVWVVLWYPLWKLHVYLMWLNMERHIMILKKHKQHLIFLI